MLFHVASFCRISAFPLFLSLRTSLSLLSFPLASFFLFLSLLFLSHSQQFSLSFFVYISLFPLFTQLLLSSMLALLRCLRYASLNFHYSFLILSFLVFRICIISSISVAFPSSLFIPLVSSSFCLYLILCPLPYSLR